MQQGGKSPFGGGFGGKPAIDIFDKQRMLGHGIGKIALGLTIPARHKGKPMGNIFDLDIDRCRIQQIEPATR